MSENSLAKSNQPSVNKRQNKAQLPTVLVVDGSPIVRKIVQTTLQREQMRVITAGDGLSALTSVADEMPDLIFIDTNLPRGDGYHICQIIRRNMQFQSTPIIMLSGKDGSFDKSQARMAGATGYLTKPFDTRELIQTAKKHLVSWQQRRPSQQEPAKELTDEVEETISQIIHTVREFSDDLLVQVTKLREIVVTNHQQGVISEQRAAQELKEIAYLEETLLTTQTMIQHGLSSNRGLFNKEDWDEVDWEIFQLQLQLLKELPKLPTDFEKLPYLQKKLEVLEHAMALIGYWEHLLEEADLPPKEVAEGKEKLIPRSMRLVIIYDTYSINPDAIPPISLDIKQASGVFYSPPMPTPEVPIPEGAREQPPAEVIPPAMRLDQQLQEHGAYEKLRQLDPRRATLLHTYLTTEKPVKEVGAEVGFRSRSRAKELLYSSMEVAFFALPEVERAAYDNNPAVALQTRSRQQTQTKSERMKEAHSKRPKNVETGKIEFSATHKQHLTEAHQRRSQAYREGTYTGKPIGRPKRETQLPEPGAPAEEQ